MQTLPKGPQIGRFRFGDRYLHRERYSYPLLADNSRRWSDRFEADCAELYRRMVFNAAVTNNDNHPRNHALLRHEKCWRLSRAYDLMPTPLISLERRDLALSVGNDGRTAIVYNRLSQAARFGLSAHVAYRPAISRTLRQQCCPNAFSTNNRWYLDMPEGARI